MHKANYMFWSYCSQKYSEYFSDPSTVLELGSYNINGSIRDFFKNSKYIGLDWRPGPLVDVVSLVHEFKSDNKFDAIVSASMLEHDPHWKISLDNMIGLMKNDGIMILSWGAALNPEHCLAEAPDGHFHALKAGSVINHIKNAGLSIVEFWYEANLGPVTGHAGSYGEVCLVGFNGKIPDGVIVHLDELLPEDTDQV